MTKRIVMVGDLPESLDRADFLRTLSEASPGIKWDWIKCNTLAFNLPANPFRKFLAQLRDPPPGVDFTVVKLACLNGREANALYKAHPDPILIPATLTSGEQLREWLFSDEAALVKQPTWTESVRIGAMLAILAKLIRNKSWNSTRAGHAWTQEADLLGQVPVYREGTSLYGEAYPLLSRMDGVVLLSKGGKQGKTKKEWCICLDQMQHIKRAILARSISPLRERKNWAPILQYVDQGPDELVIIDGEIVNETVRFHCRQLR